MSRILSQKALSSLKRAPYSPKRALQSLTRALYSLKRALYSLKRTMHFLKKSFVFSQKNPAISQKSPNPLHTIKFPKLICFFYVENHKVSTSIRGGFHVLLHKTFLEQIHSARSSCTPDARPLNGFENGPNLAENRIEYVLLTT